MRIDDLRSRSVEDRTRIEARVTYEDADLPPVELYYEAGPPLADGLEATPEAFVLPAFPVALWEGERRIQVEGALDTTFAAGLGQAASLLSAWYERCGSLTLEPAEGFRAVRPASEPHTVALFSGGVDAMAMLCENRRLVPLDHPHSIRTVAFAFGYLPMDLPGGVEDPFRRARYEVQCRRFEALGKRLGFTLARLRTNAMCLHPSREPIYEAALSAAYLAPLVASPGYVSEALIASDGEGGRVQTPHGSHPLLDVLYSTGAVRVHHVQPQFTRNDKVGLIADWEPAYDTLQVCHGRRATLPETANCGKCEKCVRTMLGLLSWKALPRFTAFPYDDVTPEMIDAIRVKAEYCFITMPDLLEGIERAGRDDLVRALRTQVEHLDDSRFVRRRRRWQRSVAKRLGRLRTPEA